MKLIVSLCLAILVIFNAYPASGQGSSSSSLTRGQILSPNQSITSPNGRIKAVMQDDGNFVVYNNGLPLWASNTMWKGDYLKLQSDGNLVVYKGTTPTWASITDGKGGIRLEIQNDGNLVLYNSNNIAVWSTNALQLGQTLYQGQAIFSNNGKYRAKMQDDGNFVVSDITSGRALWATNTEQYGYKIVFQTDGNLIVYVSSRAFGQPIWASRTDGHGGSLLVMQDDGNLVMYDPSYRVVWNTNTYQG